MRNRELANGASPIHREPDFFRLPERKHLSLEYKKSKFLYLLPIKSNNTYYLFLYYLDNFW